MKMYRMGEQIKCLNELMEQEFIIVHNKVYHRGWFQSWQLNTAYNYVSFYKVYKAIKIKQGESN